MNKVKCSFKTYIITAIIIFVLYPSIKALIAQNLFKNDSITLAQELEIGDKDDAVLFGYLIDLEVDDSGQIYVPDLGTKTLYMFSKKGELVKRIGREGKGPGEFNILRDIALADNKLYVFDPTLYRISVFSIDENAVEFSESIQLGKNIFNKQPAWIWVLNNNNILVSYEASYSLQNLDKKKYKSIYRLRVPENELSNDSILETPDRQYLIIKRGGGFSINTNIPLARKPIIQVGMKDKLIYGWNGNPKIEIYNQNGELQDSFSIKHTIIEVTKEYIDELLKKNGFDLNKLTDDAYNQIHDTFPVYDWFVVDKKNRIWIAVNTEDRQNYSLRIYDQDGNLLDKTKFPKSVELKEIRDGHAYGIREDEDGVQSVVRYNIKGL